MVKMNFDKYDELNEYFEKMHNPNPEFYPSDKDILKGTTKNEKQFVRYLLFLEVTGTTNTEEGREGKKRVRNALNAIFSLV